MRRYYSILLFLIPVFYSFGQSAKKRDSINIPVNTYPQPTTNLDRDFLLPYQQLLNDKYCPVATTTNYGANYNNSLKGADTVAYHDYIFNNNKDMFKAGDFRANVYPLFGGDYGDAGIHDYYGGVHTDGAIGKKFSYSVNYIGGFLNGPSYLDSIIKYDKVVPGMGMAHGSPQKGYTYQYWDGFVSYNLNSIFNFEAGKGKQFWGDGYRSLLLSDVTNSYPYFKITTTIWHLQYTIMYTAMQNITPLGTPLSRYANAPTKYGAFHILNWNASKRLNFSLFEAVIWHGDEGGSYRSFDVNYLNPVIFYRPVEFSLGSPDNELVGGTFKIKVARNGQFYGQVLIDDFTIKNTLKHDGFWANKQGLQFGFKEFNLFNAKNLSFQTEIDYVRPYTYTEADPSQNYSNYGQPLGDPMGANFIESASFLTWFNKNLLIQGSLMVYRVGYDTANSTFDWGQNIFTSYNYIEKQYNQFGNKVGQGITTYYGIVGLRVAYIISPKMHLKVEAGASERLEKQGPQYISSPYVYIGIKTSLGNLYNDF